MAAKDFLIAQRDELIAHLDALQAQKALLQLKLDKVNTKITAVRERKDTMIQAIRDLPVDWMPAP